MAVINLYKDLENKEIERIQCLEGLSIKEILGNKDWKNCIILANGNNVDENYLIKKDDLINVKQYPSLITATVVAIDYAVGGPISSSIKDHFKDEIRKEASNMLGDLKAPSTAVSNNNVIGQAEQLPTIRGASNQNANGKPVPFCIGETLFSPYVCGNGYSIISGDDGDTQHFIFMLQLGYSDITVKKIRMGFLNVASNPTGEIPSGHFLDIDGNFRFREGGENVTQLELLGSGEDSTLYPQRVKQANYRDHIIHTPKVEGVKENILKLDKFTELNPQRIEVEISFDKLFQKNEKNELVNTSVEIGIAISYDDGKTWKPFNQITGSNSYRVQNIVLDDIDIQAGISGQIGVSTITRNKNKNLRFVATQTMVYNEVMNATNRVGIIRVVRINEENLSTNFQDVAYLTAIRTYTFDYRKSLESGSLIPQNPIIDRVKNKTTRLAVKVKATEFIRDSLDKMDCIIEPKCRTWNGQEWSVVKSETSNPASSLLNMWEHSMLGGNAYTDKDFDLEQLGVLYDFCEEKGIKVSGILTGQKKIRDITNTILANCRSALILRGNKYSVWIDKPQLYPVTVLNNHNILKGSASNNKSFDVLPDAYLVKMVDRANDYQEAEFYVTVKDGADLTDPTTVIESISLQYITDYQQAYKFILYYHATRKLRPEAWLRKQGIEGNLVEIGDMVEIQDDTISVGIGDGGEIVDVEVEQGFIVAIYTDSKFNIADLSKEYAVTLNSAEGTRTDIVVFNSVEYTNKLYFATPISLDDLVRYNIGDVISFGIYQKVTAQALVMGKKENPDQTFDLNLVPYQEGVYTADTGVIPEYDPKTTGSQPIVQTPTIPIDFSKIPIGKDGADGKNGKDGVGLTVFPEKSALVYDADHNGNVTEQTITDKIRIEQNGLPVPFTIGKITPPSGFEISSLGTIVTIKALSGNKMAKNGVIRIPINYSPVIEGYQYVNENGEYYTNEIGDIYTYVETSPEVRGWDVYISYAKAERGEQGEQGEQGSAYRGQEEPPKPNKGDTRLDTNRCILMEWDGSKWADLPISDSRYYQAMADIISVIDRAGEGQVAIANAWVKNLVTGTILAERIFTKELTIKDGGLIKSENYIEGKSGTVLKTNGYFESQNAKIRGSLESNNFTTQISHGQVKSGKGYKVYADTGVSEINQLICSEDCYIPCLELEQRKTNITQVGVVGILLNISYGSALQSTLDDLLEQSNAFQPFSNDPSSKMLYCFISSRDTGNNMVTKTSSIGNAILKLTNNGVVEYYIIGNTKPYTYDSDSRRLIIRDGQIVTDSSLASYLGLRYQADAMSVRAYKTKTTALYTSLGRRYVTMFKYFQGSGSHGYTEDDFYNGFYSLALSDTREYPRQLLEGVAVVENQEYIPCYVDYYFDSGFTIITYDGQRTSVRKGVKTRFKIKGKLIEDFFI